MFHLLGQLEVRRGSSALDLGAPKQRAVLAFLLVHANQPVSLDRLIEELWGDQAPPRATASLQAYVSNLRRILEPDRAPRSPATVLVSRPPGYALLADPGDIDFLHFEQLVERTADALEHGDASTAVAVSSEAERLWRGEPLADFPYEAFAQPLRTRLEERRLQLLELRLTALVALGRDTEAATELEQATSSHPLRERLWELRMLSLYRAGRQADALRAYQHARQVLADELGLEPGPALRTLEQQILDQDPALSAAVTPVATRLPAPEASVTAPWQEQPSIVGRQGELTTLTEVLARMTNGSTEFVLVAGEPGIGKTTLVETFATHAGAQGARVAWGRSQERAGSAALWPWSQVAETLLGDDPQSAAQRLLGARAPRVAPLLQTAAIDAASTEPSSERDRILLFDSIAQLLRSASREQATVIVLDDLHWADTDSLTLLEFLATELRECPVMVLGTYRPDEAMFGTPLAAALGAVARRGGVTRITLEGLGRADVADFARTVAGRDLDDATVDLIADRTSGNPFFLSELVRLLASEHGLDDQRSTEVPVGVRDVVRRRIERLPEDTQSVLSVAAVIGREFDLDVLAVACEMDLEQLLGVVEPPLLAGLLAESSAAQSLQFSHAIVAETLAGDLPAVRRRRLHARVAKAIEQVRGHVLDPHLSSLAYHYGEAASLGHATAAADYAVRAAEQAESRSALDEAPHLWQLARDAIALDPGADRSRVLDIETGLAAALMRAGRSEGRAVAGAVAAASTSGDGQPTPQDVARAVRAVLTLTFHGTTWQWSEFRTVHTEVLEAIQSTLGALPTGDSAERARVLGILAPGMYYGDLAESRALGDESISMARRLGDPALIADCIHDCVSLYYDADDYGRLEELATELIGLGQRLDDPVRVAAGLSARIGSRFYNADISGADADYEQARRLLQEHPRPPLLAQLERYPVMRRLMAGDFAGARAAADRAYDLGRYASLWNRDDLHLAQLADIAREENRLHEFEDVLVAMDDDPRNVTLNLLISLRVMQGDVDEARRLLEERGGIAMPTPDWRWLGEAVWAAELAALLRERGTARALYDELLPYSGKLTATGSALTCSGPVDLYLGLLATVLDDEAAASRHLAASDELSRRIDAALWLEKSERVRKTGTVTPLEQQPRTPAG